MNDNFMGLERAAGLFNSAVADEVELLRRRIAERKPKGGRPPVPQEKVDRVEHDIGAGKRDRAIAVAYGVSYVAVNRIRRRMAERGRTAGMK